MNTSRTDRITPKIWLLFVPVLASIAWAQTRPADPLEESLIAAWEHQLQSRPETVVFERIEPGLYRYHTTFFPFDGTLRVLNVAIRQQPSWSPQGLAMGVVEVELEGLDEDFMTKHVQSYGMWHQDNVMYHDAATERWLTTDEYPSVIGSTVGEYSGWGCLLAEGGNLFWIVLLGLFVVFLTLITKKASRQMKSAMSAQDKVLAEQERAMALSEKAVEISQDSNRLLREILDAIKDSSNR